MRILALLGSGAVLVASFAHQNPSANLPEPLATDLAKLGTAKSLKVEFSKRVIGEAATNFTLELSKGDKFKLKYDDGFVLSDGSHLFVYSKRANTYTKTDLTPKEVAKFRSRPELIGWEGFLQEKPGSDIVSAVNGPDRTVQGQSLSTVDVTLKPNARTATLFIDPKIGLTQGFTTKMKDKELLVLATKISLTTEPLPDVEFAFVAPDGATLVQDSDDGSFAGVQQLMTDNCMPCHSADHKRAGIDLSSYEGVSASVVAGQSSQSLLVKALKGDGVDLMPKGRAPLSDDQIAKVAKWIDAGAKNQ
jgi:outer membrane lipoprotein-sorting protein